MGIPLKVIVDLDGVVFDFIGPFLDFINIKYGTSYTKADVNKWRLEDCGIGTEERNNNDVKEFSKKGLFKTLPLMDQAVIGTLDGFAMSGDIAYGFLTSRHISTKDDTMSRLKEMFGLAERISFSSITKPKSEWFKELGGDIFIEDHPQYLREVREKNPDAILIWFNKLGIDSEGFEDFDYQVNSWTDISKILLDIIKKRQLV